MNISSVIIQCLPEHIEKVIQEIESTNICEYHLHDAKGQIIVTIEGKSTDEEISKLTQIQQFENVISAEMVFSYNEDELDNLRDNLQMADIPEWLNKNNVRAEDIVYHGDLKRRKKNKQ